MAKSNAPFQRKFSEASREHQSKRAESHNTLVEAKKNLQIGEKHICCSIWLLKVGETACTSDAGIVCRRSMSGNDRSELETTIVEYEKLLKNRKFFPHNLWGNIQKRN